MNKHCPNPRCPDLRETGKHGEFLPHVTTCPRCGHVLADSPLADGAGGCPTISPDEPLLTVLATPHRSGAAMARGILEGAGIPFVVFNQEDSLNPYRFSAGVMPGAGMYEFRVTASRAAEAKRLLATVRRR
jgi:hypothetical protein